MCYLCGSRIQLSLCQRGGQREKDERPSERPLKDEQQQLHPFIAPKRQQRQPPHNAIHRLLEKVGIVIHINSFSTESIL